MHATEWFVDAIDRLDDAAFAIAAHVYPELDRVRELARLDDLAAQLRKPSRDELVRVLFGEVGLRGNTDDYYDPDNSFLNRVLDRALGIPISIAVVMIEVGRRAGLDIVGVNTPSHFVVRDDADGTLLDPFNRGAVITAAPPAPVATTPMILDRMLNNLRGIYVSNGDLTSMLWVLRLRTLLPGAPPEVHYELTRAQARLN